MSLLGENPHPCLWHWRPLLCCTFLSCQQELRLGSCREGFGTQIRSSLIERLTHFLNRPPWPRPWRQILVCLNSCWTPQSRRALRLMALLVLARSLDSMNWPRTFSWPWQITTGTDTPARFHFYNQFYFQGCLYWRCCQLLRHPDGRTQGGGSLHCHHCQALGCCHAEGGWGSPQRILEGQWEGFDHLRCWPSNCWRNGGLTFLLWMEACYMLISRLYLLETSSLTWAWPPSWTSTVSSSRGQLKSELGAC